MKKRIALAAAIALAISVGGMLPASATKLLEPTVPATDSCARAGGTLSIEEDSADITIGLNSDNAYLTVTGEGGACSNDEAALLGLTTVIIKSANASSYNKVTFDLENQGASYEHRLANFSAITFQVRVDGHIRFDGSQITAPSSIIGTVGEEDFSVGTLHGSYYAALLDFIGGTGNDTFDASAVLTTDVKAYGDSGNDVLKGGAGDDQLLETDTTGKGLDKLYGGAGDDTLDVNDAGVCTVDTTPDTGVDQAWGGAGDDYITSEQCDTVAPGDGVDTVVGAAKALTYVDSSAAVTIDLEDAAGLVVSTAGNDYYPTVARFYGSAFADTMLGGDGSDDYLSGGAGADTILGLAGEDTLYGGGGKDTIKGGDDADLIAGDSGADKIFGGEGADEVNGGGGDDILYGSTGDDILRGDKGADQAWGGKGTFDVCAAEVTDSCEYKK